MTPRTKTTKIKRLENQFKKFEGNPIRQGKLLLQIQTLENTPGR